MKVILEVKTDTGWQYQAQGIADGDGRISNLLAQEKELVRGIYRLIFNTGSYYRLKGQDSFYPKVVVIFEVTRADEHYHIPLLLDAYGYTTYRGN